MNSEAHDDTPDPIDALARELPAPVVPEGFADAVLTAHAERARRTRALRLGVLAASAASLAGVLVGALALRGATADLAGAHVATAHQTVPLGDDARAVLDPGAALSFTVDARLGADVIDVEQSSGRAFFRVEPGTALSMHTPAGDVVARGTCFFVELTSPDAAQKDTAMKIPSPSVRTLATTTAGAVVGAVLSVVVLEGSVDVKNPHGSVSVSPGERATAHANSAPQRDGTSASAPVRADVVTVPKAELEALRAAASSTPDTTALVKRNAELEARLQKAAEELALADEVARLEQGEPRPFPADLPARFQGGELQRAFESAMEEVGIKGGVIEVDCAEYPCTIYGQLTSREDMERLRESKAFAPYAQDSNSTSVWGTKTKRDGVAVKETYFGVQLAPEGEKPSDVDQKRQERRLRDGWERIKPRDE